MGGENPRVVIAGADLGKAGAIAAYGGFFQHGQRCTASSRVIVEDALHDRFVAALAERVGALRVGPALADDTQVRPASSEAQLEQNLRYVGIASDAGGRDRTAVGWSKRVSVRLDLGVRRNLKKKTIERPFD